MKEIVDIMLSGNAVNLTKEGKKAANEVQKDGENATWTIHSVQSDGSFTLVSDQSHMIGGADATLICLGPVPEIVPGRWEYEFPGGSYAALLADKYPDGYFCRVEPDDCIDPDSFQMTMKLISAAPDLLSAAINALKQIEAEIVEADDRTERYKNLIAVEDDLRYAIDKGSDYIQKALRGE